MKVNSKLGEAPKMPRTHKAIQPAKIMITTTLPSRSTWKIPSSMNGQHLATELPIRRKLLEGTRMLWRKILLRVARHFRNKAATSGTLLTSVTVEWKYWNIYWARLTMRSWLWVCFSFLGLLALQVALDQVVWNVFYLEGGFAWRLFPQPERIIWSNSFSSRILHIHWNKP